MGPHKSPSLDCILAFFYQEFWGIVKNDIINSTQAFFHSDFLLKSLNHTYIILVPKNPYLEEVSRFKLISLCNIIYKAISKLMINRLKPLMDNLITPFQNAFIQGRNFTNNILIAHDLFDYLGKKKGRKNCFGALKIDMTKVYDRVDWKFLKTVLTPMNFNERWVNWILECVTTIQYTLLINGNITQSFSPKKGLKQGNPLTPYLVL